MFVPSGHGGVPYPVFRAALDGGHLDRVRALAKQMQPVRLDDALRICLLVREAEPERYEQAAVRWLGRFALEARNATLEDLRTVADALDALRTQPDAAMERLAAICVAHRLSG